MKIYLINIFVAKDGVVIDDISTWVYKPIVMLLQVSIIMGKLLLLTNILC